MAKSIIFFSMHRSASTFLTGFLKNVAKLSGRRHVMLDPLLETHECNVGQPVRTVPGHIARNFSPEGRVYGPHRRWVELPGIDDYDIVLCLRDPRDVLVSLYFALCYSHDPPRDFRRGEYLERRRQASSDGIDKYVIAYAGRLMESYEAYHAAWAEHDILLLSYEQMVTHFGAWLKRFLKRCGMMNLKPKLMRFDKFEPPRREDVHKHKRQVRPGDHRRKLKRRTIRVLDNKFAEILDWLELPRS